MSPVWRSFVGSRLLEAYDSRSITGAAQTAQGGNTVSSRSVSAQIRADSEGRIQLDVHYDCSRASVAQQLSAAGFSIGTSIRLDPFCTVEGWASPSALPQLASISGVTRIEAPTYVVPRHPPALPVGGTTSNQKRQVNRQQAPSTINGNGISIMRADQFVSQTGVRGAGVTVGVQSAGVATLALIQARGELPAVQIVGANGSSLPCDEGTALLEEVHAIAPAASLSFCEPTTFVEYLSCLADLINTGATILVDDLGFEPNDMMSSNSSDAQSVEQILTQNPDVLLFTAGGNANGSYWEGSYTPVSAAAVGLSPLSCSPQSDSHVETFDGTAVQHLTVTASSVIPIALAWADPFDQNASNFDLYWSNDADVSQSGCFSASSSSSTLILENLALAAGTYTLSIGTPDGSLAGKFLKLWIGGDGLTMISAPTSGSVVAPQTFATGVVLVGAVNGSDAAGEGIESYSSRGPLTAVFPTFQLLQAPTLVAPDGISVDAAGTQFEGELFPDGNFYGTSAAVPNAGAIATLLRSAFPHLTAAQLLSAVETGATVLGSSSPSTTFGYGRADALGALATLAAPTISSLSDVALSAGVSSQSMSFIVTGTGDIHFTVTSSDTAVIPASIVAAGASGVTIGPVGCGTSTLSFSQRVAMHGRLRWYIDHHFVRDRRG